MRKLLLTFRSEGRSRKRRRHARRKLRALRRKKPNNSFLCGGMERCFLQWPTSGKTERCATSRAKDCAALLPRMPCTLPRRNNSTNNGDCIFDCPPEHYFF